SDFDGSAGFASAIFCAGTVFGASASFGASGAGATLAAFDSTLCGAAAANRSLNIVDEIAATSADFSTTAVCSGSAAKTSLNLSEMERVATCGRLTTGSS